jgi:hypothetical protein
LALLAEDRVEGVVAGLGWWSHGHLHLHQVAPGTVGVDSEGLHSVLHTVGDLIDLREQRRHNHQDGSDGHSRAEGGDNGEDLHVLHSTCWWRREEKKMGEETASPASFIPSETQGSSNDFTQTWPYRLGDIDVRRGAKEAFPSVQKGRVPERLNGRAFHQLGRHLIHLKAINTSPAVFYTRRRALLR